MKNKNIILIFIIIIFSSMLISCNGCKDKKADIQEDDFKVKAAVATVDNYMNTLMNEDYSSAKKFYTKELVHKSKDFKENKLKIAGYVLEDVNEVGRTAFINIKVTRSNLNTLEASLDCYSIKVIREGIGYKIAEIKHNPEKEAFINKKDIKQKNKNDVEIKTIISLSSIPNYVSPQDDVGNMYKVNVSKKEFAVAQFSYNGEKIAISTKGENPYIGVVNIDDTLSTAAAKNEEDSKEQGGEKKEGGDGGKEDKNKPIGKEVVSLDVIKGANIKFLVFSKNQQLLVCQYEKNGSNTIRLYEIEKNNIVPINFEGIFPLKDVDIIYESFDDKALNFKVKKKENSKEVDINILGKWKIDLEEYKLKKI